MSDLTRFPKPRRSTVSREEREREFEWRWHFAGLLRFSTQSFVDLITSKSANDFAVAFVPKIRERVDDSEVAELLCPLDRPARHEAALRRY